MKTLTELNEGKDEFRVAVGKRGRTSPMLHLLYVEDRSVTAACNRNGQYTGRIVYGKDIKDITCKFCRSIFES